jgi:hypothetical protein
MAYNIYLQRIIEHLKVLRKERNLHGRGRYNSLHFQKDQLASCTFRRNCSFSLYTVLFSCWHTPLVEQQCRPLSSGKVSNFLLP